MSKKARYSIVIAQGCFCHFDKVLGSGDTIVVYRTEIRDILSASVIKSIEGYAPKVCSANPYVWVKQSILQVGQSAVLMPLERQRKPRN